MNSLGFNKPESQTRVVVAMSGGVDSSVVAAMLHAEGYEVIGITLQLYDHGVAIGKKGACCAGQDIYDARRVAENLGFGLKMLGKPAAEIKARVDEMLALVAQAQPGPFARRTIELGRYLGFRDDDGQLIAMAGERMRPPGWGEISAVATAERARGHGLAERLIRAVGAHIVARGDTPFLHTSADNPARALYERLGFELVEALNACLQKAATAACETVRGMPFDREPMALLLLHRSCAQLQGAVLMAERGMDVEARTLARGLLENTLLMAALHDNPDKARAVMIEDAAAAKKGQAKTILRSGMSADAAMLQDVVDSIGSVSNLNISKLAELGPLGHLYLLYRVMSDDAVHPSGKSLQRHMRMADDGESWNGYLVGPEDPERIADTLDRILMIGIALGVAFTQIVGETWKPFDRPVDNPGDRLDRKAAEAQMAAFG
mgnify:CR=1 FL=1